MKAKVLKSFIDRETKELRKVYDVVELTEARAKELSEGGYVAVEKVASEATEPTQKKQRKSKK